MEEFLGPARLLLAALGFTALQPLSRMSGQAIDAPSGPLADVELRFIVPKRGVDARGHLTDEGLVVRSGSIGNRTVRDTLSKGWIVMRSDLLTDGSLVDTGTHIEVRRDVLFASPSAAAAVVSGGAWNGRAGWKNADGVTLGELESGPSASEPAAPPHA